MILLLGISFLAGVITAVSPCVLPVLPIVLAGGASGGGRRPYAIIAGLVLSFTVFTLSASALLMALGLPEDLLRNIAIALLFVVAATLLVPRFGMWIEAPLTRLSRRPSGDLGGGFLLGVSLGLVFVPCAGPVLATVSVLSAEHRVGLRLVLLTLFYAAGAGSVLLLVALGGQRATRRHPPDACVVATRAGGRHAGGRLRRRLRPGPDPPDQPRLVHDRVAAPHRGVRVRDEAPGHAPRCDGRREAQGDRGASLEPPRLCRRARLRGHLALAQHARRQAAHDRGSARQGRADRLLDVLLHQLPAHAAAPARLVRRVPQGRPRHRRRPHAGVRLRARPLERRGRRQALPRHLAGRARQRLRHVERVVERVLAGGLSRRPAGQCARVQLRRGGLREDRGRHPAAAGPPTRAG